MSVTLEVLHVPDCPNLAPMLERLQEATDLPVATRDPARASAAGVTVPVVAGWQSPAPRKRPPPGWPGHRRC